MCSFCIFCCSSSFQLVRWISRLMGLCSKGIYIPSFHSICGSNPEPWPVCFRPLPNKDLFFYNDHGILWHLKIIAVVNEGAKVLHWLSFWWLTSFCGTYVSTSDDCCVTLNLLHVADWVAWIMLCVGNFHYSTYSYKIFLRRHCFGYPELIFPLKTSFPIILFRFLATNVCWNQSSFAMNVL